MWLWPAFNLQHSPLPWHCGRLCGRYCECFASGTYCDGCNCVNCCNNSEHEVVRQEAVEATLERNPNAFRPKIANSPRIPHDGKVVTVVRFIWIGVYYVLMLALIMILVRTFYLLVWDCSKYSLFGGVIIGDLSLVLMWLNLIGLSLL